MELWTGGENGFERHAKILIRSAYPQQVSIQSGLSQENLSMGLSVHAYTIVLSVMEAFTTLITN